MTKAFKSLFYGLLMLSFHINIQNIKLFPAFVGWILICRGIFILQNQLDDSNMFLAKISAICLVFINILTGINSYFLGGQLFNPFALVFIIVVSTLLEMITLHIVLKATIKNLQDRGATDLAEKLGMFDKAYMVFFAFLIIISPIQLFMIIAPLAMFAIVFLVIVQVSLLYNLHKLRKWYNEMESGFYNELNEDGSEIHVEESITESNEE